MARRVLVDAGPLVALLDRRDRHHQWAKAEIGKLRDPLFTCEAVLSEAFFLLSRVRGGTDTFAALLRDGLVNVPADFLIASIPPRSFVILNATRLGQCLWPMPAWCECPKSIGTASFSPQIVIF